MAIIDYREEQVGWDYKGSDWYEAEHAYPTIEFFIHVWQNSNSVVDVKQTLEYVFKKDARYRVIHVKGRRTPLECHTHSPSCTAENPPWKYQMNASYSNLKARANRWRRKGVPLKELAQPPREKTKLKDLIELAKVEAL